MIKLSRKSGSVARWLVLFACLIGLNCHAHKLSDAYLKIDVSDSAVAGEWDIALRDLEDAVGLDANGDHKITWGEVRARQEEITTYALKHLNVSAKDQPIKLVPGDLLIDEHSDGAYAVLRFHGALPVNSENLTISYGLLFDFDPQHRGLLQLRQSDQVQTAVFSPETRDQTLSLATVSPVRQFATFVKEGVHHIWIGLDHILFLLALLVPAVLWRPRSDKELLHAAQRPNEFSIVMNRTIKLVTAFTIAHSITLCLATLNLINLPSRLIESVIAASVIVAAVNNLWSFFRDRAAWIVFGFGLVHGFGFASVLRDLGLPPGSTALSLGGFNIGVELGQLAIVALFLPIAFLLRDTRFYRRIICFGGSAVIAIVATGWLAERALDMRILPF